MMRLGEWMDGLDGQNGLDGLDGQSELGRLRQDLMGEANLDG